MHVVIADTNTVHHAYPTVRLLCHAVLGSRGIKGLLQS
jgi:hypothetical protein